MSAGNYLPPASAPFGPSGLNDEIILTADCVAAFRLPVNLQQFDAIARTFKDDGLLCTTRGGFFVLLKPNPDDEL